MASGKQMDRPNGGFRRGYSQDRTETQQATTVRSQPENQEEDWSVPTNIERRENETERWEITQPPPPNVPPLWMIDYLQTGVVQAPLERE